MLNMNVLKTYIYLRYSYKVFIGVLHGMYEFILTISVYLRRSAITKEDDLLTNCSHVNIIRLYLHACVL